MDHLTEQAGQMGLLRRELHRVGRPCYDSALPNGAAKEPDDGLKPGQFRSRNDDFPTLVLEVANAQDPHQARMKDWWFKNSSLDHEQGGVGIVFVVKVANDELGTLTVELWARGAASPKQATIRLKDENRRPDPEWYRTKNSPVSADLWTWSGLPMRVAFEDLVLRPKQGAEQDFDVTSDMLVDMATSAWLYRGGPQGYQPWRQDDGEVRHQQRGQSKKRQDQDRDRRAERRHNLKLANEAQDAERRAKLLDGRNREEQHPAGSD